MKSEYFEHITDELATRVSQLSNEIPEFLNPYPTKEYLLRLSQKKCLIELAVDNGKDVGFKIGYELNQTSFYSWMGGVHPEFRKQGIAKMLAKQQESWAIQQGFKFIQMKTRNNLKNMLHFSLSNGFYIIGIEPHSNPMNNRIILEKRLEILEK